MKHEHPTLAYLACPYSHPDPNVRYMRHMIANRVAFELLKQGNFVYSPLTHNIPLHQYSSETISWAFWEKYDKTMLAKCDKLLVLTLPGWEKSNGVSVEIAFAKEINLAIEMIDPKVEFGLDILNLQVNMDA
jgi:hypothetical protein